MKEPGLKSKKNFSLAAVIMAGGRGTRFWPKSRKTKPKQLLPIGTDMPLVVETVKRLIPLIPRQRIFISTSDDLALPIRRLLPEIPDKNYILEPVGRDTAPCVGMCAAILSRRIGPANMKKVMAVLPADHNISAPEKFRKTLLRAARLAAGQEIFVTLGIKPAGPSTAYGYIQPGEKLPGNTRAFWVKRFTEKPGADKARRLVKAGCLWNAGMFIFQPEAGLKAFDKYMPAMAKGLRKIQSAAGGKDEKRVIQRLFPRLQKISLDFAIMEKAQNVAVVPGEFGWSDVGGWDALYALLGGNGEGNISQGRFVQVDSTGIYADAQKMIAAVGVKDLVIVESEDAIMVLKRQKDTDLKKLIQEIDKRGWKEFL
jgi:mannose-1-phosphate guanylyltransferase